MAIITYNNTTIRQIDFGAFQTTTPNVTPSGRLMQRSTPIQVLGFVPLVCCTADPEESAFSSCDCRSWDEDDCYLNPVFAQSAVCSPITGCDPLYNDTTTFLVEYPIYYAYLLSDPLFSQFFLEKVGGVTVALTPGDETYGFITNFFQGAAVETCMQQRKEAIIDWRKVLIALGEGVYRFKINSNIYAASSCLVSEPFCLKEYSCQRADKTVKFTSFIKGGRVGSIDDPNRMFEFCCVQSDGMIEEVIPIEFTDSIRLPGFFGYEKTEFERVNYEYLNGEIVQHKNEAIQSFEFHSGRVPKYIHDRFKAYGIMSDQLRVSDYNWSNSDYDVDQKLVVCDGGYEPKYVLSKGENLTRLSNVVVQFKEGVQNVIRDKCCGGIIQFAGGDA